MPFFLIAKQFIPGFLKNPYIQAVLVVVLMSATLTYARYDAAKTARNEAIFMCRAEVDRKTAIEVERQMAARNAALEESDRRAEQAEQELEKMRSETNELVKDARKSGNSCPLDNNTRRRLQQIR